MQQQRGRSPQHTHAATGAAYTRDAEPAPLGRWGPAAAAPPLPTGLAALLRERCGALLAPEPWEVPPPAPTAEPPWAAALAAVPGVRLRLDAQTRQAHAVGSSYLDLVSLHAGTALLPAAVAEVSTPDAAVALLRHAAGHQLAVIPRGGGSSVVGGVTVHDTGHRGTVVVSTRALSGVLAVDAGDRTALVRAGSTGAQVERALAGHGLTLGHFPQSYAHATVGGWVAARSAGQSSGRYGRIDEALRGVRLSTPTGPWDLPALPASAAGPDLRRLVLGSEGRLGLITDVTLRVHRAPATRRPTAWLLDDFAAGLAAVQALAQDGPHPAVVRLSDSEETAVTWALAPGAAGGALRRYARWRAPRGCLLILLSEGEHRAVAAELAAVAAVVRRLGGRRLPDRVGAAWEHGRFAAPLLRDTLLRHGVLVETLETATTWSRLAEVRDTVTRALRDVLRTGGGEPLIGSHVSHTYETGASLYVTVLADAAGAGSWDARAAQWRTAKAAATAAIVSSGATVSHHHGVGRDHVSAVGPDLGGPVGAAVLAAAFAAADPAGVCNPGAVLGR